MFVFPVKGDKGDKGEPGAPGQSYVDTLVQEAMERTA
jgi:hypothetical protein